MNFKIISLVPYYLRPWYHYASSFSRRINYVHSLSSQFICGNGRSVEDQSQVRIPAVTRFNYGEFRVNGSYRIILDQTISAINFSTIYIFECIFCAQYMCTIYVQFFKLNYLIYLYIKFWSISKTVSCKFILKIFYIYILYVRHCARICFLAWNL